MNCENEEQKPDNYSKSILEIIHKDANESLKIFCDNINFHNTRLAILVGFDTSFAVILSRIPNQRYFSLSGDSILEREKCDLLPSEELFYLFVNIIDWLLYIKPFIGILLIFSLFFATLGLLPNPTKITLSPSKMLDRAKNNSEEDFLKGVINIRADTITRLEKLADKKASSFRYALILIAVALIVAILLVTIIPKY
jgi:hypothetical protein